MAKKDRRANEEMRNRLRSAHKSAAEMSRYAGRLLEDIESLKRQIAARDLLIEQLKDQLVEAETLLARAMKF